MVTTVYNKKYLTSREFFRSPARVSALIGAGNHIVVTKHGEEVFEVTPRREVFGKTLQDFTDLQFSALADVDMSTRIDDLAYGNEK